MALVLGHLLLFECAACAGIAAAAVLPMVDVESQQKEVKMCVFEVGISVRIVEHRMNQKGGIRWHCFDGLEVFRTMAVAMQSV